MKKIMTILFISFGVVFGQFAPMYSTATTDDGISLANNPGGLGISRDFNMYLLKPLNFSKLDSVQNDFSIFMQMKRSGFGFTHLENGIDLLHLGSGEHLWKGFYMGSTSHFSSDGYEAVDIGLLYRGYSWLSAGLNWKNLWSRQRGGQRADQIVNLGLAVRPLGNRVTIAYDHRFLFEAGSFKNNTDLGGNIQIHMEFVDGLKLFANYDTQMKGIQLGLSVGLGTVSVESFHNMDKNGDYTNSLFGIQVSEEIRRVLFENKTPTYIELSFERRITDSPTPRAFFGPKTITLKELIDDIDEMAERTDVDGIILKPDNYVSGLGIMEEVTQALHRFKKKGKKILAFINSTGESQYVFACVADSIFLNSGGFINVDGVAFTVGFFKNLFDKIGIGAQIYRRGDYKTAAETLTEEKLTETSREAYEAVLADFQETFSQMIRKGRGFTEAQLEEIYATALFTPEMALKAGLIDGIYHPDQIEKKIKAIAGDEAKIVKAHKLPDLWDYDWESFAASKIALIYAEGPIVPGRSVPSPFGGDKIIGSETTAKAIRKAREDKSVKAIVMRVNSPGGSILASEDIWREVHRTTHPDSSDQENRKPFIISMGNVAASGGYYISCAADTIVADSNCITGSIGVLSGKLSLGGLFEKIGYNVDVVKEKSHAEMFGSHRLFTEEEGERMQAIVDSYYEQFLRRVSEGRDMTRDEVDKVAQGRIWTGVDAKELGLVDALGGLDKALEIAREKAGLEKDKYYLQIHTGVEKPKFQFEVKSKSDLMTFLDMFEDDIPVARLLDRAKLIHDEKFLYLMDGEFFIED
ncbi:MAG: signal peptide peptidase SppA [Candidatus Marinimicrobia bacterium]|nr:signal peptide peptidase SppA [Candidatus Neomarinimicrobiota bacterium]